MSPDGYVASSEIIPDSVKVNKETVLVGDGDHSGVGERRIIG